MKIFGVSLVTLLIVLVAFYVGRKTTLLKFLPVIG